MNLLVSASEADPARGFMAWLLVLCSLPRSNPGNRHQYKRTNGPFTLYMNAVGGCKLPYGNLPRLILAWVCSEAVRTQSRMLVLGKSLSGFMRALGVYSSSGEKHTRLRNQMKRLFGCTVSMIYEDEGGEARVSSLLLIRLLQLGTISWGPTDAPCGTPGGLLKQAYKHEFASGSRPGDHHGGRVLPACSQELSDNVLYRCFYAFSQVCPTRVGLLKRTSGVSHQPPILSLPRPT